MAAAFSQRDGTSLGLLAMVLCNGQALGLGMVALPLTGGNLDADLV